MIIADFEKIPELRLTDFVFACLNYFQSADGFGILDKLLESYEEEREDVAKRLFKILFMLDSKQT